MKTLKPSALAALIVLLSISSAFADEFFLAGNLQEPRRAHCITLLQDGRVFVAGGNAVSLDFPLRSAEIYDPSTETSQFAGTMNLARGRDPVCVALDDGNRVLVMGGAQARFTYTNTAEIYDLSTGLFSMTGPMTEVRTAFTAYKRADGKVLAFGGIREGGFGTATPNVDLFDPATETFSLAGSLVGARHDHSSSLLPTGEILLVGGTRRFNLFADPVAEVYDPQTNTSRPTSGPVLFQPRDRAIESVTLGDGRVLIISGRSLPAELYDPSTDSFSAVPGSPLFNGGTFGHSTGLDDGRALLLGFGRQPGESGRRAEVFDPVTEEFTSVAFAVGGACDAYRAQRVLDGSVIVAGGGTLTGGGCEPGTDLVERFVPGLLALVVTIDIKPGSDPNAINPRSRGLIPVAILTTSTADGDALDFDAGTVDVQSLAFGPGGATVAHAQGHLEDVDGDGDLDLVVHFKTQDSGLACGQVEATLTGQTLDGQLLLGTDSVKLTPCRDESPGLLTPPVLLGQCPQKRPALGDDGRFYATVGESCPPDLSTLVGVAALDPHDGSLPWGPLPVVPPGCDQHPSGRVYFAGTGVSVGANGLIFGVGDWNQCRNGRLVILDSADGSFWDHGDCPGPSGNLSPHPRQVPALDDSAGSVYFGSSYLCSTATEVPFGNNWVQSGGYYIGGQGIVLDATGNVYYGTYSGSTVGRIRSFDVLGAFRWQRSQSGVRAPDLMAVVGDLLLSHQMETNQLLAWHASNGADAGGGWPISDFTRPVADQAGTIYASGVNLPRVTAVAADGTQKWPAPVDLGALGVANVAVDFVGSSGRLYVRGDRQLFAIDSESGAVIWSFEAENTIHVPAALDSHGHIVLFDAGAKLYVLDTSIEYAASDWPIAEHGNRRHTGKQGDVLAMP